MNKRILRLSASGILTMSVVACGNDEIQSSQQDVADTPKASIQNLSEHGQGCHYSKSEDLDQFLSDLQSQGRITECEMLQVVDDGVMEDEIVQ